MDRSFPPQDISKQGQAPRDSHRLLVEKDTEGSHEGTRKGLALQRDLPCPAPDTTVCH